MPLNERHFNGSRLLKLFISVSSGPVNTLEPLGPFCSRNRDAAVFFEVAPVCRTFNMEIWLALTFFLIPHQSETLSFFGDIWGRSLILYKYLRHQWAEGYSGSGSWGADLWKSWIYPTISLSSCVLFTWPVSTHRLFCFCGCWSFTSLRIFWHKVVYARGKNSGS